MWNETKRMFMITTHFSNSSDTVKFKSHINCVTKQIVFIIFKGVNSK